jgi:hypothetical protein
VPFASDLADFILGVRALDTRGRIFSGDGRGGDLRSHDEWLSTCFAASRHLVDVPRLRAVWSELRTLPRCAADTMTHGDLMPGNVLVAAGALAGGAGRRWPRPGGPRSRPGERLAPARERPTRGASRTLGCDGVEWARGQAWALQQAMGLVWYYETSNPVMSRIGRRTLWRILSAPA